MSQEVITTRLTLQCETVAEAQKRSEAIRNELYK